MSYLISKSKYTLLNLLLKGKQNNEEVCISDSQFNEFKTLDSSLVLEQVASNFYWYIGEELPSDNSLIEENKGDLNGSQGWHLIGNSSVLNLYEYDTRDSNKSIHKISSDNNKWYVALPLHSTLSIYDSLDIGYTHTLVKMINFKGEEYNIYELPINDEVVNLYIIKN